MSCPWGRAWVVCCEFKAWARYYLCRCRVMCNIVWYATAIYWESILYVYQQIHRNTLLCIVIEQWILIALFTKAVIFVLGISSEQKCFVRICTFCVNLSYIFVLTHWGRVTHICVSKLIIIGSDNGFAPTRRQAIIWTNAGILLIGPLGTNFSEILIEI